MKNQNKPVIEDVIISKEKMDELNSKLESSLINGSRIIRNFLGGSCTYCAGIPTKKVAYDVGDDVQKMHKLPSKQVMLIDSSNNNPVMLLRLRIDTNEENEY